MECPIYQKLQPMVLPNNARALLRMVLRTGRGKYSIQELEIFNNLETHMGQIQEIQAQLDRVNLTAKAVKEYSQSDMTHDDIAAYAARVSIPLFASSQG
jgi:SET and MYND domain-containing protein